jgi:hypothetical protein
MTEARTHMHQPPNANSLLQVSPPKAPAIAALPDPILSDIFILVHHDTGILHANYNASRVLASVSRLWRAIALSTCRLWDSVLLSSSIEHLSTHLGRSGHLPIDVSFNYIQHENISLETLQDSLCLLQENWSRIRDLHIVLRNPGINRLVLDTFNSAIYATPNCLFRSISVTFRDGGLRNVRSTGGALQLLLPHSPMLERIQLTGASLCATQLSYSNPFLELHTLDITKAPSIDLFDGLFHLLGLMPNLVCLSLDTCELLPDSGDSTSPRSAHSILLPKLETLSLWRIIGVNGLNVMFRTLDMPKLQSFTLNLAKAIWEWNISVEWGDIFHCRALERLQIHWISPVVLGGLLSQIDELDSLREIELSPNISFDLDRFIEGFAPKLSETACCPKLRSLRLLSPITPRSMNLLGDLMYTRKLLSVYIAQDSDLE